MTDNDSHFKIRYRAALLSLAVGIFMLILKMSAYFITDSSALMSDAMESVVHVAAIAFVVFCIRFGNQPPDQNHPYGHGKVENFSIGFEGGLICIAGIGILVETIRNYVGGYDIRQLEFGLAAALCAALINVWLGFHLIKVGEKTHSNILVADGKHVLTDSYTSFSILLGMIIVYFTQMVIIDAIIAILVALHLFYMGYQLLKDSVNSFMDTVAPELIQQIVDILNQSRETEWLDVHNMRIHTNGHMIHIDFHLVLPHDWTVVQAHTTMDKIEHHLLEQLGRQGSVMIHLDPHLDEELARTLKSASQDRHGPFTVDSVTRIVKAS